MFQKKDMYSENYDNYQLRNQGKVLNDEYESIVDTLPPEIPENIEDTGMCEDTLPPEITKSTGKKAQI